MRMQKRLSFLVLSFYRFVVNKCFHNDMEQIVRILNVGELKESTYTTRSGEAKLLLKREFVICNGSDTMACELLGDKAKMWGQAEKKASLWVANFNIRVQKSENGGVWNNIFLNNLSPIL